MFLTLKSEFANRLIDGIVVAIPSNRVNVSYWGAKITTLRKQPPLCRNPLKSGQCFLPCCFCRYRGGVARKSQSPQIGSMFLTLKVVLTSNLIFTRSRNPLKSGQCFLLKLNATRGHFWTEKGVAIPSNRVNVSYRDVLLFLQILEGNGSQSPQIGSMFLTCKCLHRLVWFSESQSPQIGSMFLTICHGKKILRWDTTGRNPLKSGQCFLLLWKEWGAKITTLVAIPSNRVNVSYSWATIHVIGKISLIVAIPSNRVNVSYKFGIDDNIIAVPYRVAIPSNRVNVSY